jgi:hypothetical protein
LLLETWMLWLHRNDGAEVRKRVRNMLLAAGVFTLLWILYALFFPGGGESYFTQYRDLTIGRALENASQYFYVFSQFFGNNTFWTTIYYLLFIFFLLGAWQRRKQDLVFLLYFVIWLLLMITWPSWQGPRFIFPLLPIFVYFTFQGMKTAAGKLPPGYVRYGQWAVYGFWILVAASFLFQSAASAYTNLQNGRMINGPFDSYSREVYDYIQEKTPADSVIVFFKPRAMRLLTGHDSLMSTECERILQGDLLVLSRKVGDNQQIPPDKIDACSLPLEEVLRNSRFIVYKIQK